MPIKDERVVEINHDFHVTESIISDKVTTSELLAWMKDNHKTGDIRWIINEGGVQRAILTEKTKIPEVKRQAIRDLLNGAL